MQLHLQGPGKQHVAGDADDQRLGADLLDRLAHGLRIGQPAAIDRLAQQQEGLDRKPFGEAPAVVVEIFGDRRAIASGRELAEAGVELVAPAIGEHAQLPRPAHAGNDVAVAQAVAHEFALQVAGRRAPTVGPQAAGDGDQLRAALRLPCRECHAHHRAQAGTDPGDRRGAATAIKPGRHEVRQTTNGDGFGRTGIVEPLPG